MGLTAMVMLGRVIIVIVHLRGTSVDAESKFGLTLTISLMNVLTTSVGTAKVIV